MTAHSPSPSPTPILILDRVSKRFAGHIAVDELSLSVPRGVIYGLLGPNGAGKTTTIRMIMDILEPDGGAVRVFGEPGGGRAHSERIGYLPEERGLYRKMRVLDEPFSGLDPVNAQVLKDAVLDLRRRGKTILFSTHIMEQAEKLCEQLCIIARGRKLVDGALSDIKRTHGGHHLVVGFDGSLGGAAQLFADKTLVSKVDNYGQYAELELASGADAQQILQRLVASGARLSKFELQEASLHKIFIDLVGPEAVRA